MNKDFKLEVCSLVSSIPKGRVITYGQIAAICGNPGAARLVGQIAHFGPTELPWHRVVNYKGKMASGFVPGGRVGQSKLLSDEGIVVKDYIIQLEKYIWRPK